ncbi:hypothetical protein Tco_0704285 [Tanacetum coccineum]|uniref:Uncharacterized protein n=1 Tax=Tanacetum coccineum TaxID=301880 RepID=A0ABQ4Y1B7_9ASTR
MFLPLTGCNGLVIRAKLCCVLHNALRALVGVLIGSDVDQGCALRRYVEILHDALKQALLVDTDTESDPEEAPSEEKESQPLVFRVPLMSEEFEASDLYRSSYEIPSPSSSPTLLVRKRYRGTSKLILDTNSEGDEFRGETDFKGG